MPSPVSELFSFFPSGIDWLAAGETAGLIIGGIFLLALIFRWIKGRLSDLNHALCSVISILILYSLIACLQLYVPSVVRWLPNLPFCTFDGGNISLYSFFDAQLTEICQQILFMLILTFWVNLIDNLMPVGEKMITWYLFRLFSAASGAAAYWAVTTLCFAFLPQSVLDRAPVILLGILGFMLLLGLLKILLGLVLTVVNPVLGAVYAFFFSNRTGKQISKAVLTTTLLAALVLLLTHFGFGIIPNESTLPSCIAVLVLLLPLWYLIGHLL